MFFVATMTCILIDFQTNIVNRGRVGKGGTGDQCYLNSQPHIHGPSMGCKYISSGPVYFGVAYFRDLFRSTWPFGWAQG